MAERDLILKLSADTSGLTEGLNQTESALEGVNQSVQEVDKSLNKLNQDSQQLTLEEKMQQINDEVKSGELSFRQLTRKLQDYQSIALAAGKNSPIAQEALQNAALLKDELDGLTLQTKNLSHDATNMKAAFELGQGVIAGFTAFKGVTAALGIESENLNKVMTQLQGLMALQMSLEKLHTLTRKESFIAMKAQAVATKGLALATTAYNAVVGTSTGLMKAFKIALASTGIGLIIVGLGLLIANFEAVSNWVKKTIDWFMGLGDVILFLLGPIGWLILAYKALFGEVEKGQEEQLRREKELASEHKKRMKEIEERKNAVIKAANETIKALELEKDTLEAQGKSSDATTLKILEAEKAKTEAVLEANNAKIQSWIKYYTDLAALRGEDEESFKASMKAQGIDLDALQEKANALIAENEATVQMAENRITKFKREQGEKRAAEAEALNKKMLADQKKADDLYLAMEEQLTQLLIANMEDGAEKELAILMDKHDKERDAIIAKYGNNSELLAQLEIKQEKELEALRDKFEDERIKKEEEYQQALIDLRLDNMKEGREKELALLREQHRQDLEDLRERYGEGTELEKELLINQKNELAAVEAEYDQAAREEKLAKAEAILAEAQGYLDQIGEINAVLDEIGERRKEKIEQERDEDLSSIERQKKAELSQENLTAQQKDAINRKFAMQEYQVKLESARAADEIGKRQFNRDKALRLAQIGIDTAGAIVKALASSPPPLSFVNAGIVGGIGAAQAAIVATQKYNSQAANIQPPDFSSFSTGSGSSGGGSETTTGGSLQDNTTTNTSDLINGNNKVVLSMVELNEMQDNMANIEDVGTL